MLINKQSVLVVGSSIPNRWKNLQIYNNNYNIINKAIGRYTTQHLLSDNYLNKLKINLPKYIIYYCGGNDIKKGYDINQIINNVIEFRNILMNKYKNSIYIVISIIKSPLMFKRNKIKEINFFNSQLKKLSHKHNFVYLEINDGWNKMKQFYINDLNHPNILGYNIMNIKLNNIINKLNLLSVSSDYQKS